MVSRFDLMMISAFLMASVCLALIILAGLVFWKKVAGPRLIVPFLLLVSVFAFFRTIGIYFGVSDAVHHPSALVSMVNLAAMVVFWPIVVYGVLLILRVRKSRF